MSITTDKTQPVLVGGVVAGVLSALPIVSGGNVCCCLWVVSGGIVAAYLLQQNEPAPIAPADGALIGFLAGVAGAFVYIVLSIPITLVIAPIQRQMLERIFDRWETPPEFKALAERYIGGPLGFAISFVNQLVVGMIFSTIGGLIGAVVFRRKTG